MGFYAFLLAIILILMVLRLPLVKGVIGELIVKLIIGKTTEKEGKEKFVINNLLLQQDNGKTSQTDHVVINKNGVFVIETKNYSGRIYGDDYRKEWTQVLNYGKVKNHFYSPVKQNAVHIHRISELLSEDIPVHLVVVFVKGNTAYIKSKYVYTLYGLMRRLKKTNENQLSLDKMKEIYEKLTTNNKSSAISNREHVANIRNTQNDIANHICPRCGGTLVERKGRNGSFWGCSNYPQCRFTYKL
jgi:hypothetical protein